MAIPYNATHVAGLIVDRCEKNHETLSSAKLQTLLYFVQMQFVMEDNTICFRDAMYAGKNGPYIPEVQDRLNDLPQGILSYADLKARFPYEKRMDPHSMAVLYHSVDPAAALSEEALAKVAFSQRPYRNAMELDTKQIMIRDIRAFYRKP